MVVGGTAIGNWQLDVAGVLILPQRLNSSRRWFFQTLISADDAKSSDPIPAGRVPSQAILKYGGPQKP